jgi:Cof subfamily protein (haloacid dehalogenase superfamily)
MAEIKNIQVNKKRFRGKLLICDMDGTLLNSERKVSKQNRDALFRFVQQGGLFSVATGRDEQSVSGFLPELPINAPVIVYNGAAIFDYSVKKIIWKKYLDKDILPVLNELIRFFPEMGAEIYGDNDIFVLKENASTMDHVFRDKFVPQYLSIEKVRFPWKKIILAWNPEYLERVELFLKNKQYPYRYFYSQPDFIEILNVEASKGSALKELMAFTGVSAESVIAMGDNMNDLDMIQFAGTGIAVSNAHPSLKAVSDICCSSNDDDAAAEVVGWLEAGIL